MSKADFYQRHLDRVSRSFAYCISQLETPLRGWISLTYLICRILDTVEDAPWRKLSLQLRQFGEFDRFLLKAPPQDQVSSWQDNFPSEIPEGEKLLLMDSALIFKDLHDVPLTVRGVIQEMISCMSAGMQYYSRLRKQRGQLRLRNLHEVNQYCFFVAGIVGETLARLVTQVEPQLSAARKLVLEAHHFGLFLQKVNLLKDQLQDEQEGRFFIHSRPEVKASLGRNALGAWNFFAALPIQQKGFRLFCAQSLFLGLASIPWTERSYQKGKLVKIPRQATQNLFEILSRNVDDNDFLEGLFTTMAAEAGIEFNANTVFEVNRELLGPAKKDQEWFNQLYQGKLVKEDFVDLGMTEACVAT